MTRHSAAPPAAPRTSLARVRAPASALQLPASVARRALAHPRRVKTCGALPRPASEATHTLESVTPDTLLAQLIAGHQAAYVTLLEQHGSMMMAVAMHYLHRRHDAEDAVQEALLNVVRSVARFEGRSSLGTWLHRIVANCALMHARTQRRKPHLTLDESCLGSSARLPHRGASPPTALDTVAQEEARQLVQVAIGQLPQRQRQVLQLREVSTLTTVQVAEVLDMGVSTTKVTAHRARLQLGRELEHLGDPDVPGSRPARLRT